MLVYGLYACRLHSFLRETRRASTRAEICKKGRECCIFIVVLAHKACSNPVVYHHMEMAMVSVDYIFFCSVTAVAHSLNGENVRVIDHLDEGGVEAVVASSDRLEW